MKKAKPFFLIISLLLLHTRVSAYEKITISSINSPPFYNANIIPGEKRGVAVDIVDKAFKTENIEVTFEFIPMSRAVWSITKGNYSALLGTPKWFGNKEHLTESIDLLVIRFMFFYKTDRFPDGLSYNELQELKKYTIGNVRGSSTIPILEKARLNMDLVSNVEQNFKKLSAGRIDLAVGVYLTGWYLLKKMYPQAVDEFATIEKTFFIAKISVIFLKNKTDLIQRFRRGLRKILKDGSYKNIIEEYYGKNQELRYILPEPKPTDEIK